LEQESELLTARLAAGERAAAEELVNKYYERIYLFFRRMGHNRQTSEDLTQECFLKVWQHVGQLKYSGQIGSWLYRIAGNTSKSYWRKNRHYAILECDIEIPDIKQDGSNAVEHAEQLCRVKNAVAGLPMKYRQAVVLHYLQQLTIIESAEAMGIREGTFKSRLNRALKILQQAVEKPADR
jgi:RNA polymerase sigma-70 factor (ECF subfamily)